MNPIIQAAKTHFSQFEGRRIEVPEWATTEEGPLVIFASPVTLKEQQSLQNIAEKFGAMEMLVHCVIMKAKDGEGKPMFTLADKQDMMNRVDRNVVARIVKEMMETPSSAEALKN